MGWNYRMPELCAAVALAQVENIEPLVARRVEVARLFADASADFAWLVPQYVGPEYEHSYWTWVVRIDHPKVSWHAFRDKFQSLGGHGVYAAWKLTYLEPMFAQTDLLGRERFISESRLREYRPGLCPVAERVAGRLLQFKTNYWNLDDAVAQADVLRRTLRAIS